MKSLLKGVAICLFVSLSFAANFENQDVIEPGGDPLKEEVWVLAGDGGGGRGVFTTKILDSIESNYGISIRDTFDLIAGTSTAGLIGLGLSVPGEGDKKYKYSPKDILEIYKTRGSEIFPKLSMLDKIKNPGGLVGPKYSREGIDLVTAELFGETMLSEAVGHVMTVAYDFKRCRPFFFKSNKAKSDPKRKNYKMYEAARGTSAASTFFDPILVKNEEGEESVLVDGGIFRNNPTVSAMAAAKRLFPNAKKFHILSIGTGRSDYAFPRSGDKKIPSAYHQLNHAGLLGAVGPLIYGMMDGASQATDYEMAQLFQGSGNDYLRLEAYLAPEDADMDKVGPDDVQALLGYANRVMNDQKTELDNFFESIIKHRAKEAKGVDAKAIEKSALEAEEKPKVKAKGKKSKKSKKSKN